jgi:hypothetical protein
MTGTPPEEMQRMVRNKIMALSGEMRFIMGAQIFESAMEMAKASLPPGLSAAEQRRRLSKHIYGKELDVWD